MKTHKPTLSSSTRLLALAGLFALLAVPAAFAATYYWDNNGTTAGFGTAGGTWAGPTVSQWSTDATGVATPGASVTTGTGDSLYFGYLTTGLAAGTVTVSGSVSAGNITYASGSGAIVLSGGTAIGLASPSTITVNNTSDTISTPITSGALTLAGTGTLTLNGANTYTGTTTINGGVLALDFSVVGGNNIISSSSALVLGGGKLSVTGKASTTDSQTVNGIGVTGSSAINLTSGASSGTLNFIAGSITRTFPGTLDITLPSSGTVTATVPGLNNGAGGVVVDASSAWADFMTVNGGTSWAASTAASGGTLSALAAGSYTADAFNTWSTHTDITKGESLAVGQTGDLRFNVDATTLSLTGSGTLDVDAGGILVTPNVATTGATITGLSIYGNGSAKKLTVFNYGKLTIASAITGTANGVAFTGPGTTILSGANSYTGATTVNGGTLQLNSVIGGASTGSSSVTVNNGGTVSLNVADAFGYHSGVCVPTINTGGTIQNISSTTRDTLWNGLTITGGTLTSANAVSGGAFSLSGTVTATSDANGTAATISGAGSIGLQNDNVNNGTITFNVTRGSGSPASDLIVSAVLTPFSSYPGNGITKTGNGIMILSGANTYTATTAINGGILQANNATALGASGNITFGGGTLQFGSGFTTDYSARIATGTSASAVSIDPNGQTVTFATALTAFQSGGLTVNDSAVTKGTLKLTGANAYTGTTTITAGTLQLDGANGAINSSSGITINGTGAKYLHTASTASTETITETLGTVDGTGTLGTVNVANNSANVVQNGNGGTTTLSIGTLAFSGAATINIAQSGTAGTSGVNVTGALTTTPGSGTVTINATIAGGVWANGTTYNLVHSGSGSITVGNFTKGTIPGLTSRQSATLVQVDANTIGLQIAGDSPKWTGLDGTSWVVGNTGGNHNWKLITAGTATDYADTDTVLFDDTASTAVTPGLVSISSANVNPTATIFNNSSSGIAIYTVSGSHGIANGSLTKNNNGTLVLNTANSYTGGTTINAGTVQAGNNSALGAAAGTLTFGASSSGKLQVNGNSITVGGLSGDSTATIENANGSTGTLTINSGSANSFPGTLQNGTGGGALSVVNSGGGTLTLSGSANTYSGGTTVSAGQLNIANSSAIGSGALTLSGGTIDNTSSGSMTLANNNNWNGSFTYAGSLYNLILSSASTVTLNTTPTVTVSANTLEVDGQITGNYGLTKAGSGTLTLGSANYYTGGTTLSAGQLNINSGTAIGTGALTFSGGTIDNTGSADLTLANNNSQNWNGSFTYAGSAHNLNLGSGSVTLSATPTVTVSSNTLTVGGAISGGSYGLAKAGAGTLTLANPGYTGNTVAYAGGLNITGGTLTSHLDFSAQQGAVNASISGGTVTSSGGLYITSSTGGSGTIYGYVAALTINNGAQVTAGADGNGRAISYGMGNGRPGGNGSLTIGATGDTTTLVTANGVLDMFYTSGGTAVGNFTVNLNGGTLAVQRVQESTYGSQSGTFKFNGGTLKSLADDPSGSVFFIPGTPSQFTTPIYAGGAMIDANGHNITIASVLAHGGGTPDGGLTKQGSGTLTLSGGNTYTGNTTISVGTLALGSSGSINNSANLSIAAGATLDVSAISSYALSSSTALSAAGQGTTVGTSAAAINGASGGTVNLGSRPITLTYDGSHPALYIPQGTLSLNGNAFTVNKSAALASGTYTIIQQASGSVSSSGTYTVTGTAIDSSHYGTVTVSGGNVNLVVAAKPAANADYYSRGPGTGIKIHVSDLLANDTVDTALSYAANYVSCDAATHNGVSLATSGSGSSAVIIYPSSAANTGDSFSYTINDGHGGTASGTVTITINNVTGQATINLTSQAATLGFFGVPGYHYVVQRSVDSLNDWQDLSITTSDVTPVGTSVDSSGVITAPSGGAFTVTDPSPPVNPTSVYYQLRSAP